MRLVIYLNDFTKSSFCTEYDVKVLPNIVDAIMIDNTPYIVTHKVLDYQNDACSIVVRVAERT